MIELHASKFFEETENKNKYEAYLYAWGLFNNCILLWSHNSTNSSEQTHSHCECCILSYNCSASKGNQWTKKTIYYTKQINSISAGTPPPFLQGKELI